MFCNAHKWFVHYTACLICYRPITGGVTLCNTVPTSYRFPVCVQKMVLPSSYILVFRLLTETIIFIYFLLSRISLGLIKGLVWVQSQSRSEQCLGIMDVLESSLLSLSRWTLNVWEHTLSLLKLPKLRSANKLTFIFLTANMK